MSEEKLKIFTKTIDPKALNQVYELVKQPAFKDCKVRIMPDVHAGAGCVIGFTADLGNKVIPNIVGVDIGCGMLTIQIDAGDIDFKELDKIIRKFIPSGRNTHNEAIVTFEKLKNLYCYNNLINKDRIGKSIGTLGGGNHFIEIDKDNNGNKYLIIHSGSRNLGKQVADYYQNLAIDLMQGSNKFRREQEKLIRYYKISGREKEIQVAIEELVKTFQSVKSDIPKELCYLEGKYRDMYLHDMGICQEYADLNRQVIAELIIKNYGFGVVDSFSTIHNYIDLETNIVRKGAISARKDEVVLIPINMRDGCIIAKGKGNDDWNQSAPHGAGRLMSRSKARDMLDLEEFKKTMSGVFTTCINQSTLDESPMAYKQMGDIINDIHETVDVLKIIKPIYNFKAN